MIVLSLLERQKVPGNVFLKATLFDKVSPGGKEVFTEKQLQLQSSSTEIPT